jgi:hypothetical protein
MQKIQFLRNMRIACLLPVASAFVVMTQAQVPSPAPDGLWLRADAGVSSPGGTLQWQDQANSIVVTATGSNPSVTTSAALNDNQVMSFANTPLSSSAGGVLGSTIASSSVGTVFVVERPQGPADQNAFRWRADSATSQQFGIQDFDLSGPGQQIIYLHGDVNSGGYINANPPGDWFGTWHLLTTRRQADDTGSITVDGGTPQTGSFTSSLNTALAGTLGVGTAGFTGDIAEILVYKTALTDLQVASVESYLNTKYFTPVPEPSQYAMVFSIACVIGGLAVRLRRQATVKA